MHKLRCTSCGHYFATKGTIRTCPTCIATPRKRRVTDSPFDDVGDGYQRQAVGIWRQ